MRPTDKGSIGLAAVIHSLISDGFEVFLPFDGASSVDLIVGNNEMVLKRLQVKYRTLQPNNTFGVSFQSIVNGKRVNINRSKIDGYAIYCDGSVYFLPKEEFVNNTHFTLSLNIGNPRARLANKYLDPKVFWQ